MTSIAIQSAGGRQSGTVERVVVGLDGTAGEFWVRCQGVTKRVPIGAIQVSGMSCERTLAADAFEAAPAV